MSVHEEFLNSNERATEEELEDLERFGRNEMSPEEERRLSIERCRNLTGADRDFNDGMEAIPDEEAEAVMEKLRRKEYIIHPDCTDAEEGAEDYPVPQSLSEVPVNDWYVLARNGKWIYRGQLQHDLEREVREELGAPVKWWGEEEKIAWHKQQLAKLKKADAAPRCEHVYADGTRCRAPRLKHGRQCYAHTRMNELRPRGMQLLAMEDANSVVLNLMQIQRGLADGAISERSAGLLLYTQQLALVALKQVTFKETRPEDMVQEEDSPQSAADERGSEEKELADGNWQLARAEPDRPETEDGAGVGKKPHALRVNEPGATPGLKSLTSLDSGLAGMKAMGVEACQNRRKPQQAGTGPSQVHGFSPQRAVAIEGRAGQVSDGLS